MTFKDKQRKTVRSTVTVTLDKKHREHVVEFERMEGVEREKCEKDLKETRDELSRLESKSVKKLTDKDNAKRAKLKNEIRQMEMRLQDIADGRQELEYYENNTDTIIDYYDLVKDEMMGKWEHKTEAADVDDLDRLNEQSKKSKPKRPTVRKVKINVSRSGDITGYLNRTHADCVPTPPDSPSSSCSDSPEESVDKNDSDDESPKDTNKKGSRSSIKTAENEIEVHGKNKETLLDEYLSMTDSKYRSKRRNSAFRKECDECALRGSKVEMVLVYNEGIYYCPNKRCGATEQVIIDSDKPSYKEPTGDQSTSPYKRINHQRFLRWLRVSCGSVAA
jgi:hypothetical protein